MAKLLSWVVLGVAVLFVILAFTALFGWEALGPETAMLLAWWGALPTAVLALLLTVAILVLGAFPADSGDSSES